MEDDSVLSLNCPESQLTNPPGHLWRDKWTTLREEGGGLEEALAELALVQDPVRLEVRDPEP